MNLVDSSGWLSFFAGDKNADYFGAIITDTDSLLVPTLCMVEVARVFMRQNSGSIYQALAVMQQGMVIPLNQDLVVLTAITGQRYRLALADAIIYATAQAQNAILWTQDKHFKDLPRVNYTD